ncbi:MAG: hypothetical protein EA403_02185 [Spirochaetaceae bacterium]|nr:MAG: hypothetical protein EA403_02185 [Spirochaetaceae bacterium]
MSRWFSDRLVTMSVCTMLVVALCTITAPTRAHAATGGPASQPMTLADAVSRALEHDPSARALAEELRIANSRARLARRDLLPRLTLGYSMMDSVRYAGPDTSSRRISIGVEQLVTSGGRRRAGHQIESIRASAVAQEHQERIRGVTMAAMEQIARVLIEEMAHNLFMQMHEVAGDQLRIARAEFALGLVTQSDLTEMELAVRAVELDAVESRHSLSGRRAAVRRALGLDPDVVPLFRARVDPDYRGTVDLEYLRETVSLQQAAALVRAKAQRDIAEHELRVARSAWLPSLQLGAEAHASGDQFPLHEPGLSLTGSLRFGAPVLPNDTRVTLGTGAQDERTRALSAAIHPGDGLNQLPSFAAARLALDQSRAVVTLTRREIADATSEAIERVELLRARIDLLRRRLGLQRDISAIRDVQIRLGEITRIRALEQDVETARTEVELLRTIAAMFAAELHLIQLTTPERHPEWLVFLEEEI